MESQQSEQEPTPALYKDYYMRVRYEGADPTPPTHVMYDFHPYDADIHIRVLHNYLPVGITHLWFNWMFNYPVHRLPEGLTHLVFGAQFNNTVDSYPSTLQEITFGNNFNQPLTNIPPSVRKITLIGNRFQQPLDHLTCDVFRGPLDYGYPRVADDSQPVSYAHILGEDQREQSCHPLSGFTRVYISAYFSGLGRDDLKTLPDGITHLWFGFEFNSPIDHLPEGVTDIVFLGPWFDQPVDHLPSTVKRITFGSHFNHPVNKLPKDIEHLIFGSDFRQSLDSLPIHCTYSKVE